MEQQISFENWNPEKGYFPKKEIENKQHQTQIINAYADMDQEDHKLKYFIDTYDSKFGDRRLQITGTQARFLKNSENVFSTPLFLTSEKTKMNGKDCFSLKISFDKTRWY